MTEYYIPAGPGEAKFTEKRSDFLGHVRMVETEDAARAFIDAMKKEFYDARHNSRTAACATPTTANPKAPPGCPCWRCSSARA